MKVMSLNKNCQNEDFIKKNNTTVMLSKHTSSPVKLIQTTCVLLNKTSCGYVSATFGRYLLSVCLLTSFFYVYCC